MADDQVKYSELLVKDEDVFANLIKELGDVKTKISELKTEASGLSGVLKNISTATREQQQATAANAKSVELLAQKTKDLAATKKNLEDATKRFGNLTDEEVGRLDRLATKLKFSSQWQEATAKLVDTTNMSYNEMKATLAVLTNALHTFGTEEKKNSDEAKALENAIERVRDAMKELDDRTKAVAAAEKQMAEEAKKAAQEEEEAYKASQKEAAKRVKTQEELHNARQKEIEDAFKARDAEMAKMKLTEEEYNSVKQLKSALAGTAQEQIAAMQNLEIQNKSYNELYQTYNAIKDVLKAMTTVNTEAGKAMTAQAAKIYDTMNELQKATGKYTLQVGKYRAAFDGLGYSFQQILREAPSALNLNQFFLAISNNVPQFIDQLKAFNDEQKEIKANLAQMTEGTKEYSEQLGKVMTVGQKLGKTLLSWQTLVLVGLLIIRNWEKIVNLFQKLFNKVEDNLASLRKMRQVVNEIDASVESGISKIVVELGELTNRLDDVTQGSVEWKNITERINEIMGDNYDLTGKMPGQIKQITAAYIAQAEQLAKNQFVVQKISENADKAFKRQRAIETILQGGDVKSAAKIFGYEEGSDEYKALERAANTSMPLPSQTDANEKIWEVVDGKPRRVGYDKWMTDQLNRTFDELDGELFTSQDLQKLWDKYYKAMPEGKGDDGKEPKDQVADLLTLTRQLEDQIIANIENEYKRLDEEETKRHERFIQDQEAELAKLAENDPRRAVINQMIEEENRTHERKMEEIDEKRYQNLQALTQKRLADEKKAAEDEEKQEKDNAKTKLKAAVDGWAQYKAKMVEEGKTRKQIVEAEVAAEIARLNLMLQLNRDVNGEKMSDEQKTKVQEWINLLEKLQQTGNYGDYKPGQFMGKGGANVTNERKNYANIWEVLGIDMDNNQVSALNSVFDQAKEALNSWMDARKAAADLQKLRLCGW